MFPPIFKPFPYRGKGLNTARANPSLPAANYCGTLFWRALL